MTITMNVITQHSNKSIDVVNMNGNFITNNMSNEVIDLTYDTSYIVYIEPYIKEITYTGFLDLSNTFLSGFFGYIWVIIFAIVILYLLKMVKNYV